MRPTLPIAAAIALALVPSAPAYIEAPMPLGSIIAQSTVICSMVVAKVDRQNNIIIYQKVADLKGKHPQDTIKHNIGRGGLRPGEWEMIMKWAEPGKQAVMFHNGGASETFIGVDWYQCNPAGDDWWGMVHAEPYLLRAYAGKADKLPQFVADILAGKEVVVPCLTDGDREALHGKTAKAQRLKASLAIQDYDPKRDFQGWGGEDIRRLAGVPGFDRLAQLGRADAAARAATAVDFDADGKPDLCLVGANKVLLLQNGGDGFAEVSLPGLAGGARAAVWADYTGGGRLDLFLATPAGPRLFTNLGKGRFRDDTRFLPADPGASPSAAAWADFDGDGKPDLLIADGFRGLRLLLNRRPADAAESLTPPAFGDWSYVGPFGAKDNGDPYPVAFPPEREPAVDLKAKYDGKRDQKIGWQKGAFADGTVNNLGLFGEDNDNSAVYLSRDIEVRRPADLPVSFGSDDTLTVWLNGDKVLEDPSHRACAADQNRAVLKLKAGKNRLLLKVSNGSGEYGFYFRPGEPELGGDGTPWFADVSTAWGLGPDGPAGDRRADGLSVADFDGDGRPDVLVGAGTGVVLRNAGGRFEVVADAGIRYAPGKVGPALGDFDGDGAVDLFVPQMDGACKLFRNDGTGKFADVTAAAGDLAKPTPGAVGAAWGDFDNDGRPDLVVGVLRGPNRLFRNNGDGTFTDTTAAAGLLGTVFNTQAAAWADLDGDGRLDLILVNEGQESVALYGRPAAAGGPKVPLVVRGTKAAGGVVAVVGPDGKRVASAAVSGGDGRGGQAGLVPRFALAPGAYTVRVTGPGVAAREKAVTVGPNPTSVRIED